MNIYKVKKRTEVYYDEFFGCVCVAENEQEAREIHPKKTNKPIIKKDGKWFDETKKHTNSELRDNWIDAKLTHGLHVEFIGVAAIGFYKGVIMESYNQG